MKKIFFAAFFFFQTYHCFSQLSDSIFVVISGDTIYIWNTGVYENCASNFWISVSRTADTVTVKETDLATQYATCMCYFDLNVAVTGYPAGNYYVKLFRKLPLINPDTLFYIGSTTFSYGGSSLPYHTKRFQSECYEPSDVNTKKEIPDRFSITQNYPNPFNPVTTIQYSILQSSQVQLKVFDVLGNQIETLVNEEKPAGTYELTWNAEGLPSGVYFYQLRAGSFIETKKMVLMK